MLMLSLEHAPTLAPTINSLASKPLAFILTHSFQLGPSGSCSDSERADCKSGGKHADRQEARGYADGSTDRASSP